MSADPANAYFADVLGPDFRVRCLVSIRQTPAVYPISLSDKQRTLLLFKFLFYRLSIAV